MSRLAHAIHANSLSGGLSRLLLPDWLVLAARSTEREVVDFVLWTRLVLRRAGARAGAEHRARVLEREMSRLDPHLRRDVGFGPDRFGHGY